MDTTVQVAQTDIEISAETLLQSIKSLKKTQSKKWITAEEFFKIAPKFGRCELVEGEIVQMSPTGGEHGAIAAEISARLLIYVKNHDLGKVFAAESGLRSKLLNEVNRLCYQTRNGRTRKRYRPRNRCFVCEKSTYHRGTQKVYSLPT